MMSGDCFQSSPLCEDPFCQTCKNSAINNVYVWYSNGIMFQQCGCFSNINSQEFLPSSSTNAYSFGMCYTCSRLCSQCTLQTNLCMSCRLHATLVILAPALETGYCKCSSGYYESNEDCLRCTEGCTLCSSLVACSACDVGYELKASAQQSYCVAFASTTGCAQGSFLHRQTGVCELFCPSGFIPVNRECQESSQTKYTWRFDQFSTFFYDSSGNFTISSSPPSAYPVYKRGLHIVSGYSALMLSSSKLILAPTFYFEIWYRGAHIDISRNTPTSNFYYGGRFPRYWYSDLRLSDVSGVYLSTYSGIPSYWSQTPDPDPVPTEWQRVRFELVSVVQGRDIVTKYRVTLNNQILGESTIRNYYYKEGSSGMSYSSLSIFFNQVGAEAYIAEFTIANRIWQAETTSCGCPLCTSNGACLSNCALNQYISDNNSCQACPSSCTKGCLRGTDCVQNFDPLCNTFSNFTTCQTCNSLAVRKEGVCGCQANAKFLTSNSTCVCDDGSKLNSAGFCAKCLNYLRLDDVTTEIDENFMSLIVTFKKPMAAASGNCKDLFTPETVSKFGAAATCSWTPNRKQLTVLFGAEATLVVEEVELNYESFLSTEGPCSFEAVKLRPKAGYKGNMPEPLPSLTAPTIVAMACGVTNTRPVVSAQKTKGGKGRKLQFKWAFHHSVMGAVLTTRESYSEESSVTLFLDSFSAGNLTATVTVRNSFQKEASLSSVIRLTDTRALSVQLDTGPQLTLTSQNQGQVRILVTDSCGDSTGSRSFQWNFLSVSPVLAPTDPSPSQVLQASNTPSVLYVKKNSLAAGHSYIFEAVVTQGAVQGSATLNITVVPSLLVARLNRVSGYHPSDMTLRLDGTESYDPDNSAEAMSYLWTCSDGSEGCKDAAGAELVKNYTTGTQAFQPDRLRTGANYNFTLTISKGIRKSSTSVVITIILPTGCNIALKPLAGVINSGLPLSIVAGITTSLEVDFLWRQTGGPTAQPSGGFTFAYLSFRADSLQGGQTYGFELTAKTIKGNIIAPYEFYVNRGPMGGKTTVTPSSGRAILDQFLLSTEGWEDPEGNYPLNYQFCLSLGSSTPVCIGALSLKLWTYMKLFPGDLTVTARVFDYYGALSESTARVTVSAVARRLLQDLAVSFQNDIQDPENTCGMITVYCQSVQVSESLYTLMVSSLKTYTQSLNLIDLKSMESILGAVEALAGEPPAQLLNQAADLLSFLSYVMSKCTDPLTFSSTQRALTVIARISSFSADSTRLAAANAASAVLTLFTQQRLPNETPTSYSSQLLNSYAARVTGGVMGNFTLSLGVNATVVAPVGWLNDTKVVGTDIIDIYARTYLLNSSFAWVVDLVLQQAGSYANYNMALTTPTSLRLSKLAVPLNVTIPLTQLPANATLECIAQVNDQWLQVCEVLEIRTNSVVVSSFYVLPVTVRSVPVQVSQPSPAPFVLPTSAADCSLNPAPLSLACAALLLGLAALSLLLFRKSAKISEPDPRPPTSGEAWITSLDPNKLEQKENPVPEVPILSAESPTAKEMPVVVVSPRPHRNFLQFHLLFSCVFYPEMRLRKLWTLVSIFEVETLILGLCYSFWDDNGDHADNANDVFSFYSGEDLAYVAVSLACGAVFGGALQAIRMHPVPAGVNAVLALAGTIYLNVEQCCYSEGGRWGEGLLWTVLLQLLLLESAKAGVRLFWSRRIAR